MILPVFSWLNFLAATIILLLTYLLMQLIHELLSRQVQKNEWLAGLKKGLYRLLRLYEIIVFLILGSVFIFINPILHGSLLLAVVVFSFSHIRNYVSGKLASLDDNLSVGLIKFPAALFSKISTFPYSFLTCSTKSSIADILFTSATIPLTSSYIAAFFTFSTSLPVITTFAP